VAPAGELSDAAGLIAVFVSATALSEPASEPAVMAVTSTSTAPRGPERIVFIPPFYARILGWS